MFLSPLEKLHLKLKGKRLLVFGLGQQGGVQVANILAGIPAVTVRVTDQKPVTALNSITELDPRIQQSLGGHQGKDIEWADVIIKNPAVPFDHPLIVLAEKLGKPVTTETALALSLVREHTVGITGTRGKTTTTSLIFHLLETAERSVILGGNIPQKPLLAQLANAQGTEWFVVELSSFHLEACEREHLSPAIAVLTNIYPDHLNRYASLEDYARTKMAIFRWQESGDLAFSRVQPEWQALVIENQGEGSLTLVDEEKQATLLQRYTHHLRGPHNDENVALAIAVAEKAFGLKQRQIQKGLATFTGVPSRLETIANFRGTEWINDTTSTTPIALEKALDSMTEPFLLIAGGTTKHLPFSESLLKKLQSRPRATFWLDGSGTRELLTALHPGFSAEDIKTFPNLPTLLAAVQVFLQHHATPIVLFSPGFSSFELFQNEFDRGDQFVAAVQKLQSTK